MMDAFLDWQKPPLAIVADKAYGSTKIRQQIADEGALAIIPSKSNARTPIPHDKKLCASRETGYPDRVCKSGETPADHSTEQISFNQITSFGLS